MENPTELVILVLGVLGLVGRLGGGRKWAFRTLLATLLLAALGAVVTSLYIYGGDRTARHRAKVIHQCAVAKIVNARCVDVPQSKELPTGAIECPGYFLVDDPTKEQEEEALAKAEKECTAELDPSQQSLHQEIARYREEHGIKETRDSKGWTDLKMRLGDKNCADKVRKAYPHAYDDLSDAVLSRKLLTKYPTYCDITAETPGFIPSIEGIR
jgi:hypothetical protein